MARIDDLEDRLTALEASMLRPPCSAALPHSDMVYLRGPNIYVCNCGMHYKKDAGALVEVEEHGSFDS